MLAYMWHGKLLLQELLTCMLNSWPLPSDSATYGSGPSVADAAVIGEGPAALPPPGLAVPPSAVTPAGRAGPPPSDGKSDSSNVIGASDFEPPAPACNARKPLCDTAKIELTTTQHATSGHLQGDILSMQQINAPKQPPDGQLPG
jgi:hypothetical protein